MKKLLTTTFILLIGVGLIFSQSITVTSPNGGENWDLGSTHNITWTSSGVSGNVGIKLFQNGTSLGYIAQNIPVSAGTYSWEIDEIIGVGPISAGVNYQIQVKQSGVAGDLSNGNFTICTPSSPPPPTASITVTSPNGGENWELGSTHNVTWTSSGVSGNVGIKLFQNGTSLGYIAQNIPVSAGTYSWEIDEIIGVGPISAGVNYQIQVKQSGAAGDMSNGNFTISGSHGLTLQDYVTMHEVKPHSITVINPNRGRNLPFSTRITILWRSKNLTNRIKISLVNERGTSHLIVKDLAPGRISYDWRVGKILHGFISRGSGLRIKVEEQETGISDMSDRTFSIVREKHVDLSCRITGHSSSDHGRVAVIRVKVRVNNIGREVLRNVPVRMSIVSYGTPGPVQTSTIREVTYRGSSYEYSVNFSFRFHRSRRANRRRELERTATVVVDPDDTFRDKNRINNRATYDFVF